MRIRAVICDVYNTLIEVGPAPGDAARRWNALCREMLGDAAPYSLDEFHARSDALIAREQAAARNTGIAYPEIYWPCLALEALPPLGSLGPRQRADFLFCHAALRHTVRLMPGAAEALRAISRAGIILGIASNAQPYTLGELAETLGSGGLWPSMFVPELTFWSFEHGFAKPDPHVFRLLSARLHRLGIGMNETLMVGDRPDNDIEPARAQGWQTWLLSTQAHEPHGGGWGALCRNGLVLAKSLPLE